MLDRGSGQGGSTSRPLSEPDLVEGAARFVCRAYELANEPGHADHSLQVGHLLAELGCSSRVVAAGILHDVVEDAGVAIDEIVAVFGDRIGALVYQLSEDRSIADYRARKLALRRSVQSSGRSGMLIFAADKLARMRTADEDGAGIEPLKLEHYERSLELLVASGVRGAQVDELRWRLRMRRGPVRRPVDAGLFADL